VLLFSLFYLDLKGYKIQSIVCETNFIFYLWFISFW